MSKDELQRTIRECVAKMPQRDSIEKILLFGSHLHGDARSDSDVDLLVELRQPVQMGFFEFMRIQRALEHALRKNVDLGTPDSLSKYIRDDVLKEAQVVYERQ